MTTEWWGREQNEGEEYQQSLGNASATASAYRTSREEQRAQREAKEDLSKKEAGGDDQGPVCLHSTGAGQKHPEWSGREKVTGVHPSLKQGTHSLHSLYRCISRVLHQAEWESTGRD